MSASTGSPAQVMAPDFYRYEASPISNVAMTEAGITVLWSDGAKLNCHRFGCGKMPSAWGVSIRQLGKGCSILLSCLMTSPLRRPLSRLRVTWKSFGSPIMT